MSRQLVSLTRPDERPVAMTVLARVVMISLFVWVHVILNFCAKSGWHVTVGGTCMWYLVSNLVMPRRDQLRQADADGAHMPFQNAI